MNARVVIGPRSGYVLNSFCGTDRVRYVPVFWIDTQGNGNDEVIVVKPYESVKSIMASRGVPCELWEVRQLSAVQNSTP